MVKALTPTVSWKAEWYSGLKAVFFTGTILALMNLISIAWEVRSVQQNGRKKSLLFISLSYLLVGGADEDEFCFTWHSGSVFDVQTSLIVYLLRA